MVLFLILGHCLPLRAQWETQSVTLRAGWNSVFLLVDPEPALCDQIFPALPFTVETVRTYKDDFTTAMFDSNSPQTLDHIAQWITWVPANSPVNFARDLFALKAGRAYFIKLPTGAPNVTWNIKGRPYPNLVDWKGGAFNLAGFRLDTVAPPTFQSFFGSSPLHASQSIFRMNSAGVWVNVTTPGTTTMVSGEAFWIFMALPSTYQGPIRVETDQRGRLDYGRSLSELSVRVINDSTIPRTVRLTTRPSEAQPASVTNTVHAGSVPLAHWSANNATRVFGWTDLGQVDITLAAGETREMRLMVRRSLMVPLAPPQNSTYQAFLDVKDLEGPSRWSIPVIARGLEVFNAQGQPQHPYSGLWVGYASVNKVNQPASLATPTAPVGTASDFTFRLIVHVDATGQARLVPWVIEMFKEGVFSPNPQNPLQNILTTPGRQVWVTDRAKIPLFSGSTLRDGEAVGRRISTSVYSLDGPALFSGAGNFGANTLTASLATTSEDRLNPFKHKYHPDHDNLNDRFDGPAVEAFPFTRALSLQFTAGDPEGLAQAGFGETQVGGIYRETITGVHKSSLFIEGPFRLNLISRINVLNDGL